MQLWWGRQRVLVYNDASIPLLGTRHPGGLARSGADAVSPELWAAIGGAIQRAFETGESAWCEGVRMLLPRRGPDEETFTTFSFAPIIGEDGSCAGVFSACVDVTENVLANRRLSLLHRLGTALAPVRALAAATKTLGDVIRGSDDIQFAGLYLVDDRTPRLEAWIDHAGARDEIDPGQLARVLELEDAVAVTTAGAQRAALAVPLRGTHGVTGVLVCGLNPHLLLDDNYRSFLELVAAHLSSALADIADPSHAPHHSTATIVPLRANDAFLAVVAHELRNPLSALMTTVQALMLRSPSNDVELMERSVRQLSRIVDNLLDLSRVARGRLELRPRPTELANAIDRAMELVTPLLDERHTQVFVRVPRVGLRLDVDPDRVAQAIANLLSNAARFSEPGSRVWIHATREYDRARLVIEDEGTGIEPDRLAVIFDTFAQPPELRPRTSGLGLGLPISRGIVELHGGTLKVHSAGAGQGTQCIVELPVTARLPAPTPTATAPATPRRRLLLVEDNDDTARALKNALEQLGYVVALAHNGPVALNVAREFDPDVVLLDIGLPVMDGWELAKRLRELRDAVRDAPIVAVTAYDRDVDKQRSSEAGFAEHLVKPIDLGKLQEVVESLPLRSSALPS